MEDRIIRDLEPTKYLKNNLYKYIEAFISYYGEEYREYIENKLNNTFIIAYQNDDDLLSKLRSLEEKLGQDVAKEKYKAYYERIEYNSKLRIELLNKYRKEYAKRVKCLLPIKYHEIIEQYIKSEDAPFIFDLHNNCYEFEEVLGDIETTTFYDYFTEEMDEKLNNSEVEDFEKQTIIKKRIEYFKTIGIDRGDDYSNYTKLEEYPTPEMIREIRKIKKQIQDLYNLELNSKIYPNCLFIKKEKEMGLLLDSSEEFSLIRLKNEYNCVHPNIRNNNGTMELIPEMFIYTGIDFIQRDNIIIHELNHIIEMVITDVNENIVTIRSGWDKDQGIIGEKKEHIELECKVGKYERLNEIINELLAIDIHKKFKSMYGTVFSKENSEYNLLCCYLDQEYIVKDFFEIYKKEIIESRLTGNMQVLFDAIGEENFEALNNLVNEDYQATDAFTKTTLHENIEKRRDSILKKMNLHAMVYTSANNTDQIKQERSEKSLNIS